MKERVQSFGRFLSGMVMPNIGAFIAWGLITALFIATGFEMLVNNLSVGILGMLLAIVGFYLIGPLMAGVLVFLSGALTSWSMQDSFLWSLFSSSPRRFCSSTTRSTTVSSLLSEHSRSRRSASPCST